MNDAVLRFEIAAALWLIMVALERPASLDEWRPRQATPTIKAKDKHGNDIIRRAA